MPSIILKKYSEPETLGRDDLSLADSSNPYTYSEWVQRNYGIAPNNPEVQYQKYLLNWYSDKTNKLETSTVKEDYINLLKRLNVVFRDDPQFRQFSTIDFDDKMQLKLAVPYYVKKLKEIALYYKNKRESIRLAKIKYNMIGSFNSIERTFYDYILKAFTKRDYVLNVPSQSAWNMFPDLSSVNTGFSIEIEELYDDTDYFDEREEVSYSYELSSSNPLFFILDDIINQQFNVSVIQDVPLSGLQIPINFSSCVSDYSLNAESLPIANEKYLGTNKYYLTGGYFEEDFYNIKLDFQLGNNFFYWFSGEYIEEAPHPRFVPIPINDLNWVKYGATSSPVYSAADTIFVNNNGSIEGAWLSNTKTKKVDDTMQVNVKNNKVFKFPYPSIGISAEGLEWTGKGVSELDSYYKSFFPDQSEQNETNKILKKLYWLDSDSISSVKPISIHDTTLIDSGAFPSKKFHLSDKVITRPDTSDGVHDYNPDEIFDNELTVDWLYDFDKTQLPILDGITNIYWPLQTFTSPDDIPISYTFGDKLILNSIPISYFVGSTAGTKIENADMIFRLETSCGPIVEAAWLKGAPLSSFNSCITETLTSQNDVITTFTTTETNIPWTPARLNKISAWWNVDNINSSGGRFSGWPDLIYNKPMESTVATKLPIYDNDDLSLTLNGQSGITNVGYYVNTPHPITIGIVFNVSNLAGTPFLFDRNTSPALGIYFNGSNLILVAVKSGKRNTTIIHPEPIELNTWYYAIAVINGDNSKLIVNGVETIGKLHNTTLNGFRVGARHSNNNFLKGKIRDVVVIDSKLSISDETELKTYLAGLAQEAPTRPIVTTTDLINEIKTFNISKTYNTTTTKNVGEFVEGAFQAGVMFKADSGKFSRFIWTDSGAGPSRSLNSSDIKGFHGFEHDDLCPYKLIPDSDRISLTQRKIPNSQWKKCECGAINYSPMGHTGNSFRLGGISDYILLDTTYPDPPTLDSWVGSDDEPWSTSVDFAWFKLDSDQIDGTTGWGKGRWVTNSGKDFLIKPGKKYLYFRRGLSTNCDGNIGSPYFIGKHEHCSCRITDCNCEIINCLPQWYKAIFKNGQWVDSGQLSEMELESGSHYQYMHKDEQEFSSIIENNVEYSDCLITTSFLLSVPITNSKPYWAVGTYENNKSTLYKGLMYNGEGIRIIDDYLYVNLPLPTPTILTDDLYFRYERNIACSTDCFLWEQPLSWDIKFEENKWNKLYIDPCVKSDILHFIQNTNCEICYKLKKKCQDCCDKEEACGCILDKCVTTKVGISATPDPSDILLKTHHDFKPVFVNYHAQRAFRMPVRVVDSTLGLPPSGGRWVEESQTLFTEVMHPWANIASLYDPFIATVQSSNLYTKDEVGFFTPDKLGFTNLILSNKEITLKDVSSRSVSSVDLVIDTDHYSRGPYSVKYTDSLWMKHKSQCLGGNIKNASTYQEFTPYQTMYESVKVNNYGIQRQHDVQSPWVGESTSQFIQDERYPKNIKGEYPITCGPNSWYNNQPEITGTLVQWKSDIYGNNFGLYKTSACNIWTQHSIPGELWIRDLIGNIAPPSELLSRVIDTNSSNIEITNDITSGRILNFDIFYDTLLIQTPSNIVFERLNMDFDDGEIYSIADNSSTYNCNSSEFAGAWLNEKDKLVTFAYMSGNYPIIHQLDIDNSNYRTLFGPNSNLENWQIELESFSTPKLTYNTIQNTFNITFKAVSASQEVLIVSNFNYEDTYILNSKDVKVIPMDSLLDKELIATTSYDDKLLFIFEQQTCPNQIYQIVIDN